MSLNGRMAPVHASLTALGVLGKAGVKRVSRAVAEEAKTLIDDGFAKGQAPDGRRWPGLVARKGQPLRDTGRLQRSLAPVDTGKGFRVSTNLVYARLHQYGGKIKAKGKTLYNARTKTAFGKSVTVPARPYLPRNSGALPARWSRALDQAASEAIAMMLGKK